MKSHTQNRNKFGVLTLVPTPISELGEITASLKELLLKAFEGGSIIAIEDEKPARRRWRAWDLPREAIESFVPYNEHTRKGDGKENAGSELIQFLKDGKNVFLMSDGGMPGFCDPGRSLIASCHRKGITVTTTACENSLIPTVSMSGFTEGAFEFLGFPPREKDERKKWFDDLKNSSKTQAFMDTPYRLDRVISELQESYGELAKKQYIFLLCDINRESESSYWGPLNDLSKHQPLEKAEFVLVLAGKELF
jgi:16S rRNA (cytidine1402-2'-O)-methyltransferase